MFVTWVKDRKGEPFPLTPGMELEYWLEAVDNSDHPNPGNRSAAIDREIAEWPPKTYQNNSAAFVQAKQEAAHMRLYTAQEIAAGDNDARFDLDLRLGSIQLADHVFDDLHVFRKIGDDHAVGA